MLFLALRRARRTALSVLAAVVAALLAGALVATKSHAQTGAVTYVYLRTTGDTLGIEVITRSATSVAGVLSIKGQPRFEWNQAMQGHTPGILALKVFGPGSATDAQPVQTGTVEMRGDSAFVDFSSGTQHTKQAIGSKPGALSLINSSVIHASLLATHAHLAQLSAINVFLTSGAQTMPATVAQAGDTTVFKLAGSDMRILMSTDGLPSAIGIPSQGARVVRAAGAVKVPTGAGEIVRIDYSAPSGAPYTAEQITIPSGRGYTLAATLTKPKGVAKMPVFVTITGSGQQERDERLPTLLPDYAMFREVADTLSRRGIAVLRFDDRGAGESGGRETLLKATSADFADDVRSVVAYLRTRPDIDVARIGLAGHSEGGLIAPMVASTDPKIHAIALLAGPAYDGRRVLMFQNRQGIDNAPGLSATQRDSIWKTVPAALDSLGKANAWIGYFMTHDPIKTARLVKQPVLILQGATDKQVTPEQADTLVKAFKTAGNTDVTMKKFPATNHLFLNDPSGLPGGYPQLKDPKLRREMLGALADWAVRVMH